MKKIILLSLIGLGSAWTAYSQYTQIPDPGFEQALIDLEIDSEGVLDGQVLTSDIENVEVLDFGSLRDSGFNNLIGLEDFTSLKTLNLDMIYSEATSLDLSVVPTLEYFSFDSGQDNIISSIEEIILTNNPNLKKFESYENWMLRRIDLRGSDLYINSLYFDYDPNYTQWEVVTCDMIPIESLLCVEVTDPEALRNKEGNYTNWEIDEYCLFYTTDCTLSVSDFEMANFKIYPNPAKEFFQIETTVEMELISVYDVQGKKIKTFAGLQEYYPVTDLSPGLYFVKIQLRNGENFMKKLLVE